MDSSDFDRVVDCAAEVFALHGFTGVGMRELSQKCGVSTPTLYYYFGSKDQLFEAVCHRKYRRAIDFVTQSVDFSADLDAQLQHLGEQLFDLLTTDRTLFLLLRRDLIHGSISTSEFRSQLQYEGMIDILRKLLLRRHDAAEAQRLAFTASALIFGYCEFVHVSRAGDAGNASPPHAQARQDLIKALRTLMGFAI